MNWGWLPEACPPTYHIHFGTLSPGQFQTSRPGTTFEPGRLEPLTTYYWRIDAENVAGTAVGEVWSFTTESVSGDFDGDGDVDQEDFGFFQSCYSDASATASGACVKADLNSDGFVNHIDFEIFRACLSVPNVPADKNCDNHGG
jgi:hypothetical protein